MWKSYGLLIICLAFPANLRADDWPMFGRDRTRNAVSPEKGAPDEWQVEKKDEKSGRVTPAKNILWKARLGSRSLGGPIVKNGLIWVGTNSHDRRVDPRIRQRDMAVLLCLRERDGMELWRYHSPRLPNYVHDGPWHSMGTPLVEGDRLWLTTNRCETVCFDIGPLVRGTGLPKELWKVDMIKEFGVFPHADLMASGFCPSPALDGDRIFAGTSNGVDETQSKVLSPDAPSLVCFDKRNGKALWKDASPGKSILHSQRSSALVAHIDGVSQVIIGQGDGWLRSFNAANGKLIWKCDLNPKGAKYVMGGNSRKNYVMAAPVLYDGRVYIGPGQSPENYEGDSDIYCIDPKGKGDVSAELDDGNGKGKPNPNSRVVWRYGGPDKSPKAKRDYLFGRTLSNCTIANGLVYICEIAGYAYCLDAATGKLHWEFDCRSPIWSTPLWVDGKVYFTTEDGDVCVFAAGKEMKLLKKIEMDSPIYASPVFANGVLYMMTDNNLFAIRKP